MKNIKISKKDLPILIGLIFLIIAVVFLSLVPPQLLKIIVDEYLLKKNLNGLLNMALIYLSVVIFIGLFDFLKNVLLTVIGERVSNKLRRAITYKLERIDANYFSANNNGAIVSMFTNYVDTINTLFSNGVISMIIDSFKIIGIVVSIWIFSKELGIITIIMIPIIFIITKSFKNIMLKAQIRNKKLVGKVNNHISETINNLAIIKIYGKEKYMEDKYKDYLYDNYKTIEKVNYIDSIYSPIIMILRANFICLIVFLTCKDVNILNMSLGMVTASIELISNLFTPIESLGMEFQTIQDSISGIYKVEEFFNTKEDLPKNPSYTYNSIIKNKSEIEIVFHDLTFHYTENISIINNFSLKVNGLDKVTFVGRTGVGKSTLFKLTMGLLKPCSGLVTINGIDTYKIPNEDKRKIFGFVEQNFSFINGTIYDQISLKDDSISREDIMDSMSFVGLHTYVSSLENGYETLVNDDTLFSKGQKQLLAIARAMVTDPPVLLLDEITANLDSKTEEEILSVLQKASSSKTILSISHRLSSIMQDNKIIDLSNFKYSS